MQTKIQTKTIVAVAIVVLAVGSVIFGLTFISRNTGQTLSGNPYTGTASQTGTTPATTTNALTTNSGASSTASEIPGNTGAPSSSTDLEISCTTKSADGLVTNVGYARKENGAIQYRSVVSTPNGYNGNPCRNDSGWGMNIKIARCSVKAGGGTYVATNTVSKTTAGIKSEGTAWQKTGPTKATCFANWPGMDCIQVATYAKYSNGPCVQYASPCDVPSDMTIVDVSACPAGSNI